MNSPSQSFNNVLIRHLANELQAKIKQPIIQLD